MSQASMFSILIDYSTYISLRQTRIYCRYIILLNKHAAQFQCHMRWNKTDFSSNTSTKMIAYKSSMRLAKFCIRRYRQKQLWSDRKYLVSVSLLSNLFVLLRVLPLFWLRKTRKVRRMRGWDSLCRVARTKASQAECLCIFKLLDSSTHIHTHSKAIYTCAKFHNSQKTTLVKRERHVPYSLLKLTYVYSMPMF